MRWGSAGRRRSGRSRQTTTPLNAAPRPTALAAVPISGPNSAPAIAAPSAPPISAPRRSAGASATIHARPPDHEHAPPMPSTSRAMSSASSLWRKPNASVETASRLSPSVTVNFGPARAASTPAGIDATQRAERIARGHHPGGELRQVEFVGEARQERRDRRVEHRVDEHDRADDEDEPPLRPVWSRRPSSGGVGRGLHTDDGNGSPLTETARPGQERAPRRAPGGARLGGLGGGAYSDGSNLNEMPRRTR